MKNDAEDARNLGQVMPSSLIVVVDEDDAVRKSLKFSLEIEGFVVRTYARGEQVLDDAMLSGCRCFVIDQNLPGMSGIDLIVSLRGKHVMTPAILITSHPSAALVKEAASAGVQIVEKPLLGSSLLECVRNAVAPEPRLLH